MVIIGILFTIGESFVFKNISILYLIFCTLEYKCTHNSLIKKDLFIEFTHTIPNTRHNIICFDL